MGTLKAVVIFFSIEQMSARPMVDCGWFMMILYALNLILNVLYRCSTSGYVLPLSGVIRSGFRSQETIRKIKNKTVKK